MQGEVTADLVSPLYDESVSAPSAQRNVTIQGSHKDMTNLFQFKSWRHRFEPATVLLNTNLDQQKTADVTKPKGSAADKRKFFEGGSSSDRRRWLESRLIRRFIRRVYVPPFFVDRGNRGVCCGTQASFGDLY